jgi:ActR/RegA family two-component response regulator
MHQSSTGRSILLIDDDELIAGSLRQYLVVHGCAADLAHDGAAAIVMMRQRAYAVVLVDPYLTGSFGLEHGATLRAVRDLQPEAEIFVVTAYPSAALMSIASHSRTTMLQKPQPVMELGDAILRAAGWHLPTPAAFPTHLRGDS